MLQLIIRGPNPQQRLRHALTAGKSLTLGRTDGCDIPVPWEHALSRTHARLECTDSRLEVNVVETAPNPVFHQGRGVERCSILPGDYFVIGQTSFWLVAPDSSSGPEDPVEEVVFTRQQLQQVRFQDADRRIEVLSRLPDVISGAGSRTELHANLSGVLLAGIPHADAVAVVALGEDHQVTSPYWERRREAEGEFRPSSRLVRDSLARRQSVLHTWEAEQPQEGEYTVSAEFDWAFCTPVVSGGPGGWGLYVTGRLPGAAAQVRRPDPPTGFYLHADVKFTELVAEVVASTERLRNLEGNLSVLRQFLSPPILRALEESSEGRGLDEDLLSPRECDVTVLFCDLRGFSQKAEEAAGDLSGLLERVSSALEIMTQEILHYGGVTGDFLGDASLGFWGWPFPSEEAPLNACRAALAIRRRFQEVGGQPGHPLSHFEVGIGVARGRAMAGKIGTSDRMTVTVFGPVVNLASRLQGMTRHLHVPILIDEETAGTVRKRLSQAEGRVRRLAKVLPYGLETPLIVSELLPPVAQYPDLTDEHLSSYEEGVEHFLAGRWEEAYRCLHAVPPSDRAQDFLTMRIAQNDRTAPRDWNGVIALPSK